MCISLVPALYTARGWGQWLIDSKAHAVGEELLDVLTNLDGARKHVEHDRHQYEAVKKHEDLPPAFWLFFSFRFCVVSDVFVFLFDF